MFTNIVYLAVDGISSAMYDFAKRYASGVHLSEYKASFKSDFSFDSWKNSKIKISYSTCKSMETKNMQCYWRANLIGNVNFRTQPSS